ncbi:class I SAM-dependent methyltransferase [Candidatus Woesearchaeota archaeon]|nr:class I SAM-dependent methyltransferase [Candidatus Woesearchaeota archaeon]
MSGYLESCQSEFWKKVFEKELDYLLTSLKGYNDILSVGCGPAIIETGLEEHGFNVTGLDVSIEAFKKAPENIQKVVGNAENMAFTNLTFDAAVYVASLQFIDDYKKAVYETARVLRPKGRIVIMLLNPESEYFNSRVGDPYSYINKIKHVGLHKIEETINQYFSVKTEYYLGIIKERIFPSKEPGLTSLYIIQGIKK